MNQPIWDAPRRPRMRTREALGFLAAAGETLASSLDYEATLQAVAELAVPRIACFCLVDVLDDGRGLRRPALAHVDPARAELLRATASDLPELRPGLPLAGVLLRGEPLLVERVEEAALPGPQLEQLARLDTHSFIAVPLIARGRILGALELGSTRTDRFYGSNDLDLALELARLAALSIDNARLFEAQRAAVGLRDEVLSIVAHDLRNPLNTIHMAAELIEERHGDGSDDGLAAMILRSAETMNQLIQDLLDVARVESGGRLPLTIGVHAVEGVLEEAVASHRPEAELKGLALHVSAAPVPALAVDRTRVLQLLHNLIGNALKFTDRGEVCVAACPAPDRADAVLVTVADTGAGIPADEQAHIFDRFWQARTSRRGGAGLGLAIAKSIVESHGGTIAVHSTPGHGTEFRVTLPAADETDGSAASGRESDPPDL
jgi:signal transduction histidine kinase